MYKPVLETTAIVEVVDPVVEAIAVSANNESRKNSCCKTCD